MPVGWPTGLPLLLTVCTVCLPTLVMYTGRYLQRLLVYCQLLPKYEKSYKSHQKYFKTSAIPSGFYCCLLAICLPSAHAGRLLSAVGRLLSAIGRLLSAIGRLLSAIGRLLSAIGLLLSAIGRLLSAIGRLLSAIGLLLYAIWPICPRRPTAICW
jgi:hypothetical protein